MEIKSYDVKQESSAGTLKDMLMPTHPFRMLMVGSSSCGKTTTLMNMLLESWGIKYNKLYVVSPTLFQPKYQYLIEHFKKVDSEVKERETARLKKLGHKEEDVKSAVEAIEPVAEFFDSTDEFNVDSIDPEKVNCVIFDDVVLEKNQMKEIQLFSKGRHKNCSVIYLSQSYFAVPKTVRLNVNCRMLWCLNKRERADVYNNLCTDIDKQEFEEMLDSLGSYEFMMMDSNPRVPELKYRKNFDQPFVREPRKAPIARKSKAT